MRRMSTMSSHPHEHTHDHDHDRAGHSQHDHDASDHDYGWAPLRYVLLLVPIILFLLGLPNKGPAAKEAAVALDMTQINAGYAGMIASAPTSEGQILTWM